MSAVELWRPVDGFAGYYEVSSRGRVRGVARVVVNARGQRRRVPGRLLKVNDGHVTLYRPGRERTTFYVSPNARKETSQHV